jgi:uncharacterized membrane protein
MLMDRERFMKELALLLWDVDAEERQEALNYYEDYFDDAGEENEERVISDLKSPAQVAITIRAGIEEKKSDDFAEFTEHGYQDKRFKDNSFSISAAAPKESTDYGSGNEAHYINENKSIKAKFGKRFSPGVLALIIFLCILASPMIAGLFGVAIGLAAAAVSLLLAMAILLIVVPVILIIAGIICIVYGVIRIVSDPLTGFAILGIAAFFMGIGLLLLYLGILFFGRALPSMLKGTSSGIKTLFGKKKKEAYV